ncbi:hypothetical protein ACSHWO_34605 [Streptomyces sp. HUAS TT3]|uniref:hypothetical protein n=1 Tax=Streptomyces sp. HUAS TT3 TaxID=3447510 RepID=UPI003F65D6DF
MAADVLPEIKPVPPFTTSSGTTWFAEFGGLASGGRASSSSWPPAPAPPAPASSTSATATEGPK